MKTQTSEMKKIYNGFIIIHLRKKHFVLFEEIREKKIIFWDPAFGLVKMDICDFEKIFSGIIIWVNVLQDGRRRKCLSRIKSAIYRVCDVGSNIFANRPGVEFVLEDLEKSKRYWHILFYGRIMLTWILIGVLIIKIAYGMSILIFGINLICLLESSRLYQKTYRRFIGYISMFGMTFLFLEYWWICTENIYFEMTIVTLILVELLVINILFKRMISLCYRAVFFQETE